MNKAQHKWKVSDKVKFQGQNSLLFLQEFKYWPLTFPPQQACKEDKTLQIFQSQGLFMEEGILRGFERGHNLNKNDTPTKNMPHLWVNSVFWRTEMIHICQIVLATDD